MMLSPMATRWHEYSAPGKVLSLEWDVEHNVKAIIARVYYVFRQHGVEEYT